MFLWLKLIGYIKGLSKQLAAFVRMLRTILWDVKEVYGLN